MRIFLGIVWLAITFSPLFIWKSYFYQLRPLECIGLGVIGAAGFCFIVGLFSL